MLRYGEKYVEKGIEHYEHKFRLQRIKWLKKRSSVTNFISFAPLDLHFHILKIGYYHFIERKNRFFTWLIRRVIATANRLVRTPKGIDSQDSNAAVLGYKMCRLNQIGAFGPAPDSAVFGLQNIPF